MLNLLFSIQLRMTCGAEFSAYTVADSAPTSMLLDVPTSESEFTVREPTHI